MANYTSGAVEALVNLRLTSRHFTIVLETENIPKFLVLSLTIVTELDLIGVCTRCAPTVKELIATLQMIRNRRNH
jgi:hypothetical protein